jgi:hypothetical protein
MDQSGPGTPPRNAYSNGQSGPGVSRNEYDALADLFLNDAAFGPGTPESPASQHDHSPRKPVDASHGLHLTSAPSTTIPSAPHTSSASTAPNVWRLVGEPVQLEIKPEPVSRAPLPNPPRYITIEAIVQGHLPIFASAWVPQYARSIAQETRAAVALIRVRHGQISVERFAEHATGSAALPKHATLAEAVESACAPRVLVQVDELSEPDLWRTPGLDRITVLTGADEAAMVACYRTLKTIAHELAHDLSPDHVEDAALPAAPALAVAVLGATSERAQQTITRIQRACTNFLSRQVQGSHAAGRIGSGSSEVLFRGVALDGDSSPVALIALIRASTDIAADVQAHTPQPLPRITTAVPTPLDPAPRTSAWDRVAARLEEKLGPAPTPAAQFESKTVAPAPHHPAPHVAAPPADSDYDLVDLTDLDSNQVPSPTPQSPVAESESIATPAHTPDHPHLATFVDELLAIDEQCPYAETVEFAIAADGRLHLLAHTCNHTHTGHPGNQGRALEELTTAASWAMAHARLFTRAHAGMKLDDTEHRPILHLITDRPREARRLLESDIRVHLVAPVDPDAKFICRDLN